jgi:hypothetical protein
MTDTLRTPIPRKLFLLGATGEYRRWAFEPRDYPALPDGLRDELRRIEPTLRADGHRYWPVQAVLNDGRTLDSVCLMDASEYMATFERPWPELLNDSTAISVLDVAAIRECPCRLSAPLIDKLSRSEEFRVGASAYSLLLKGGATWPVIVCGLLDFTTLPPESTAADILDVTPLVGGDPRQAESHAWCLAEIGEG